MQETCSVCNKPFTDDEWSDRHTDPRDRVSDCHDYCCPKPNCVRIRKMIEQDQLFEAIVLTSEGYRFKPKQCVWHDYLDERQLMLIQKEITRRNLELLKKLKESL